MRSGQKNALVSIFTQTEVPDPDYNSPVFTEVPFKTDVFCLATPRRGQEVAVDGQILSRHYFRFEFDYLDVEGITANMYIRDESGNDYEITGLMPDIATKSNYIVDAVTMNRPTGRG